MPTDTQIDLAKRKLIEEMTFKRPSIAEALAPARALSGVQQQIELSKVTLNRYRLGDEILTSSISELTVTKMHRPDISDPGKSSEAAATYQITRLKERSDGATYKEVTYGLQLLYHEAARQYAPARFWHFSTNGYEFGGVMQRDAGSKVQRDAVLRLLHAWRVGARLPRAPVTGVPPCSESGFFYDPRTLAMVYTADPSLNFSREEMVMSVIEAMQRYDREGQPATDGSRVADAPFLAQSFDSGALSTGKEASLRSEVEALTARKGDKLTPGDLFYCALKASKGNVRDALVTSHAALYRDPNRRGEPTGPTREGTGYSCGCPAPFE